jgi:hypothetical protein
MIVAMRRDPLLAMTLKQMRSLTDEQIRDLMRFRGCSRAEVAMMDMASTRACFCYGAWKRDQARTEAQRRPHSASS